MDIVFGWWMFLKQLRWVVFACAVAIEGFSRATNIIEFFYVVWKWHYVFILLPTGLAALYKVRVIPANRRLECDLLGACVMNFIQIYALHIEGLPALMALMMIGIMIITNVLLNFWLVITWGVWRDQSGKY